MHTDTSSQVMNVINGIFNPMPKPFKQDQEYYN